MKMTLSIGIFLIACLVAVVQISASVVNKEITRTIDATAAVVKLTIDIKATNVDGEYDLSFLDNQAKHIAFLSASSKGKTLSVTAPVSNGNSTTYSVIVSDPSPQIKVLVVFTDVLEPFPKEISQNDNQLVLLRDNHVFYSPYKTETQKTIIKIGSGQVESYTKKAPHSHKKATITYGPYTEIAPNTISPAQVHYVNNKPFAKLASMQREVEVSHWGNIAFEEQYELKHAGAKLKGGFSRFDYQMKRQSTSPSFRSLTAILPIQAHDIYYRDQIGNISTSDMKVSDGSLELEIQTRFPIFGGWQTQFYIGYSLPTEAALFLGTDGRYNLKFDFFTIFTDDVWVEDMEVKVVLPEGSTDIKVDVPYPMQQESATRFTYLDSEYNGGRPVIILRGKNFVEEHDKQIVISYKFSSQRMIIEPLMLVASYFAFFVICSILARFNGGSSPKDSVLQEEKK